MIMIIGNDQWRHILTDQVAENVGCDQLGSRSATASTWMLHMLQKSTATITLCGAKTYAPQWNKEQCRVCIKGGCTVLKGTTFICEYSHISAHIPVLSSCDALCRKSALHVWHISIRQWRSAGCTCHPRAMHLPAMIYNQHVSPISYAVLMLGGFGRA